MGVGSHPPPVIHQRRMSIAKSIEAGTETLPVLSDRDIAFRIALTACPPTELDALEADIRRYERTGMMTRRVLRLLEAAAKAQAPRAT